MHLWAHYMREHSPLLLQVSTTNPVELWHSVLKGKGTTKSTLNQFSLLGIAKHVLAIAKEYDLRAERAQTAFCTRVHPIVAAFPQLRVFPYTVQQLLVTQIKEAIQMYEDEEEPREFTIEDSQDGVMPPMCDCTFFRQWQLPCKHVWHHHVTFGSLTSAIMKEWE